MTHPERVVESVRQKQLGLRHEVRREAAFRRASPFVWWGTLLAPLVITSIVLSTVWIVRGWTATAGVAVLAVSSLFFGKFIILGGSDDSAVLLSPEELVVLVVLMDVMGACWLVYHLGFVYRLPVLGPRFTLIVEDGEHVLAMYPWMRRAAFVGLVVFVTVPFAMTGNVGGTILARLLGMTRLATFAGLVVGSMFGAGLIYLFGSTLEAAIGRDNPVWMAGGVAVVVGLILLLNYRYAKAKARARIQKDSSTDETARLQ
jgi:hypothetical protein